MIRSVHYSITFVLLLIGFSNCKKSSGNPVRRRDKTRC